MSRTTYMFHNQSKLDLSSLSVCRQNHMENFAQELKDQKRNCLTKQISCYQAGICAVVPEKQQVVSGRHYDLNVFAGEILCKTTANCLSKLSAWMSRTTTQLVATNSAALIVR